MSVPISFSASALLLASVLAGPTLASAAAPSVDEISGAQNLLKSILALRSTQGEVPRGRYEAEGLNARGDRCLVTVYESEFTEDLDAHGNRYPNPGKELTIEVMLHPSAYSRYPELNDVRENEAILRLNTQAFPDARERSRYPTQMRALSFTHTSSGEEAQWVFNAESSHRIFDGNPFTAGRLKNWKQELSIELVPDQSLALRGRSTSKIAMLFGEKVTGQADCKLSLPIQWR